MKTQAKWVMPVVILSMAFMVLLAVVSWMQVVFSSPMSEPSGVMGMENQTFGMGRMMGNGMMSNIADTSNGSDVGKPECNNADSEAMGKMHQDPQFKEEHEKCAKTMGTDHDNMHKQTHGETNEESI